MSQNQDTPLRHHDRTEFQLERIILFTDAVFAIAITLLIIEIKVPEYEHRPTDAQVWTSLLHLIPKFVGFVIGFGVIAQYWTAHHRIFRYLQAYDGKLLFINFLFLMSIVLMPFTLGLFSEYGTSKASFTLYAANIMLAGLAQVWLQRHLRNPQYRLIAPADASHPHLDLWRPMVAVGGFGLAVLVLIPIDENSPLLLYTSALPLLVLPFSWLHGRRHRRLLALHLRGHHPKKH